MVLTHSCMFLVTQSLIFSFRNSILTVSKQLTIELAFNGCYTSENVIRKPSMVLISTILSRGDDNERMMILNMLIYSLNQQSDQVLTHGSHPLTHSLTYSLNQQTKFNFMLKCLVVIVDNEIDSRLLIQLIEICTHSLFHPLIYFLLIFLFT